MGSQICTHHRFVDLCGDAAHIHIALIQPRQDILDILLHCRGGNPVFLVIGDLLGAAAIRFRNGAFHAACDAVSIHDDTAIRIARCPSDGLNERGFRTQKALFVGVQNCDKPTFRNVQSFAQQVDPDQNVKGAKAQIAQNLDPFDCVDIAVHIAHAHALFVEIFGQIFGHALGQCGDKHTHALGRDLADFIQQIIHLRLNWPDLNLRV